MKTKERTMTRAKVVEHMIMRSAEVCGVDPMQVVAKERGSRKVSKARNISCYLLRPILKTANIGAIMGRRGYTCAYSACMWVEQQMDKDHEFCVLMLGLLDEFKQAREIYWMD